MKIEQQVNSITSTMGGEQIRMGIAAEDMSHIMGVLTNLYKDRLLAVVREYSTNAWDAHIEAGFSGPIEVTLPTAFNPFLVIRDYGVGLDTDGIRQIYSQYGRSTKRNTNDQVGMLGLGCKSALTYTDTFTVSSVRGSVRTTVLVGKDEEGGGYMQILDTRDTDEANGTTVTVSIRREDITRTDELVKAFFKVWPAGSVLVNGEEPVRFDTEGVLKLSDSIYLHPDLRHDVVVMGNVAYPVEMNHGGRNFKVLAFVPIGAVKPTPSREALMDTALTKNALAQIETDFKANLKGAIQRDIDAAATHAAALQTVIRWNELIPSGAGITGYTYKGQQMPGAYVPEGGRPHVRSAPFKSYGRKSETNAHREIGIQLWPTTVWVENFAPDTFTARHKNKLIKWSEQNKIGWKNTRGWDEQDGTVARFALLPGKAPQSPFIDQSRVVSWEVVKKIQLEDRKRTSYSRVSGSFDGYEDGVRFTEKLGDDLPQSKAMFYYHGNVYEARPYADALHALHPQGSVMVCLGANRIPKFTRELPAALEARKAVTDGFAAWRKAQDAEKLRAVAMEKSHCGGGFRSVLMNLEASKVEDPKVKDAIRIATLDTAALTKGLEGFKAVIGHYAVYEGLSAGKNPLERYPLISVRHLPHTYAYMNAVHAAGL